MSAKPFLFDHDHDLSVRKLTLPVAQPFALAGMNASKSALRESVKKLFFLSKNGVMRFYPGGKVEASGENLRRSPWYTRAIANTGLTVITTPEAPRYFNASSWIITVSKALLHRQVSIAVLAFLWDICWRILTLFSKTSRTVSIFANKV